MRITASILSIVLLFRCGVDTPTAPPTPVPARDQFIRVTGSHLALEDGTPFFVQGAVYWDSMYPIYPKATYPPTGTIEVVTPFWIHQDFNELAIEQELINLRDVMHLNTIRIMTPAWRIWRLWMPEETPDWFQPDGRISPLYLDRLQRIVAIAKRNDVRVTLLLDLNLIMDWECPTASGGWEFLIYPNSPRQECRLSPPGSEMDRIHRNYTRSVVEAFRDNPTILMYEVSGEVLLNWPLNGLGHNGNEWYAARMASFVRRRITEIRALDSRHPLTVGEVTGYHTDQPQWWGFPSPEFGLVDDIDGLNGGRPYTLESVLDVISPHVYNFNLPSERYEDAVVEMRTRTTKPIILGEFGYRATGSVSHPPPVPLDLPVSQPSRVAALRRLVAMQGTLTEGGLYWNPYGPIPTPASGTYQILTIPDGRSFMVLSSKPERRIWGVDFTFTMFRHDSSFPLGVRPLPEILNLFPPI